MLLAFDAKIHLLTWQRILQDSARNTTIFARVFPHIPSDSYQVIAPTSTFSPQAIHYDQSLNVCGPGDHGCLMPCLSGHLVRYPLRFLADGDFEVTMLHWTPGFLQEIAH
jgi:hypothetical protein